MLREGAGPAERDHAYLSQRSKVKSQKMATNLDEARSWLTEHEEAIIELLDPEKAVERLRRECPDDFSQRDRDDVLLGYQTPRDRTEKLVDILRTRAPEALEVFREVIITHHPQLAAIIQPVNYRILWLCPTAEHAAMASFVLESYSETRLLGVEEGGPDSLVCRSSGLAFGRNDVLVKLVFPVRPELFPVMLSETVNRRERVELVLLTGGCEALRPDIPAGAAVLPSSAREGEHSVSCPTAVWVRDHKAELQREIERASWKTGHSRIYRETAYMDYYAAWLGRLYIELTGVQRGQRSSWLGQVGWREGGVDRNSDLMSRLLPDWDTGRLAQHLLREKRTWRCDPSSPLGMAPTESLLSRLHQRRTQLETFPSVIGQCAPSDPTFRSLSAPEEGGDVTDTHTHQFYRACSEQLLPNAQWLSCVCVCHDTASDSHKLTSFTAVTMAMEVVQMLLKRFSV